MSILFRIVYFFIELLFFFKSAGPAKETKADKRKKDKKGNKGGWGANRPVSGKPGEKREAQANTALSVKVTVEQNKKHLDPENNEQSMTDFSKNETKEGNFTVQNSNSYQRETGANENKESKAIDSGREIEESESLPGKPHYVDDRKNIARSAEQVNTEEDSARDVKIEGKI